MTVNEYIDLELPNNLQLDTDWRYKKIQYWKFFMGPGMESIPEEDRCDNFEELCNALLAKLVVYDAFQLASKGSFIAFIGGGFNGSSSVEVDPEEQKEGGNIKSIETGPTKVEFFSTSTALKELLTTSASGTNVLDNLFDSMCSLSNRIGIKVPFCDNPTTYSERFIVSPKRVKKFSGNKRIRHNGLRRY